MMKDPHNNIYYLRNKLLQRFKSETPGTSIKLPILQLKISEEYISHFLDIHDKLNDTSLGISYYEENNKWVDGQLNYAGNEHDVEIKSHGRHPSAHRRDNYISFSIRMKDGETFEGADRFNLILYERVNLFFIDKFERKYDILRHIAEAFDVMTQDEKLVKVKINDWDNKLYYIEHRLNNNYMKRAGLPNLIILKRSENKSMLYNNYTDIDSVMADIRELLDQSDFPDTLKERIYSRYWEFNSALKKNKIVDINKFFDPEYITSYEAARMILGFDGHGSSMINLYVFLDTVSFKFYPVFTRDNFLLKLWGRDFERRINYYEGFGPEKIGEGLRPLSFALSQNDSFRQFKYRKIYSFIKEELPTIGDIVERIIDYHERLYFPGLIGQAKGLNFWWPIYYRYLEKNMGRIKRYLEHSDPWLIYFEGINSLILRMKPNSMSELKFRKFIFELPENDSTDTLDLHIKYTALNEDSVDEIIDYHLKIPVVDSAFDLIDLFSEFSFHDAIDDSSYNIQKTFFIEINHHPKDSNIIRFKNVDFELFNEVTNREISRRNMRIRKGKFRIHRGETFKIGKLKKF